MTPLTLLKKLPTTPKATKPFAGSKVNGRDASRARFLLHDRMLAASARGP